jgi:hypothetical protein
MKRPSDREAALPTLTHLQMLTTQVSIEVHEMAKKEGKNRRYANTTRLNTERRIAGQLTS